jgi:hypothetical protein
MSDASVKARAVRLRRVAALEIDRHREAQGYLGGALEGSLATGALWPTSDADFTVVPRPGSSQEDLIAWERAEALPFVKEWADGQGQIDVCGEREGIPWHKHVTGSGTLHALIAGYPSSFIRPAEGAFDPRSTWFLDGLAVMEVVDDPDGLLSETRAFVATRRFAPEVWEGRRAGLLRELRRLRDLTQETWERGEADAAYRLLSGQSGFAAAAAQIWLESARQIVSCKEQDGRLAEVAEAAGCPEAHTLYRRVLAVEPDRAEAAAPLLLRLAARVVPLYRRLGSQPPDEPDRHRETRVWGAYAAHLAGTLGLAPGRGNPAHLYPSLGSLRRWTIAYPGRLAEALLEAGAPGAESLIRLATEAASLAEQIDTLLLDPAHAARRAQIGLDAANRLLELTEKRR